jgi:hypothetical protein
MLSPLGETLRRHDPDRFLTVLFAPPERRETLITLFAFNHELARARDVASQTLLALIRLQWWREVVEGEAKPHEVATPLSAMLVDGRLDRTALLALIEAREAEVDGDFPTTDIWRDWLLAGAGGLAVAAGMALGVTEPGLLAGLRLRGAAPPWRRCSRGWPGRAVPGWPRQQHCRRWRVRRSRRRCRRCWRGAICAGRSKRRSASGVLGIGLP